MPGIKQSTLQGAVLVSHKHPFPTDDGKKAVLAGFVAWLVDRFGSERVTYVVLGHPPAGGIPEELPCRTVWIAPPGRGAQALQAVACMTGLSRLSLQEALTRSGRVADELRALMDQLRPSLLLLDTIRAGQYFEQAQPGGPRRVLYMDDLFHLRFARLAALGREGGAQTVSPAGTFAPMLPGPARALLAWAPVRDALYRLESKKVERREVNAPAQFDTCLLISPEETDRLRALAGGADNIQAVRPLLQVGPAPLPRAFTGEPLFVLFGTLKHPVHRAAVLKFVGPEGDAVFDQVPGMRLVVVGDGADAEVVEACRARSGVELAGFVPDIAPLFARACGLLVPSQAGGGLRLKAITALRHGLPIVSTRAGIEGLSLQDGQDVLLAETTEAFASQMRRLLDLPFNQRLSVASAEAFEQEFGRSRVFADFDRQFGTPRPSGASAQGLQIG